MALSTLSEIRSNVASTARETQINSLIDTFINLSLQEINDPAWAFEQAQAFRGYNHLWSFNRRKFTFPVMGENNQLPRDCDKIALIRQINSPTKLQYIPDELFYKYVPNPTATGNPLYYRIWEEEGLSTRLATDDSITVLSSSATDSSQTVSVVGYSTLGYVQSETISLNGTTPVAGTLTYDAGRPIRVSKSAATTGYVTVRKTTAPTTTLVILSPEDRSPRFRVLGLYPIPTADTGSITAYADSATSPGVNTTVTSAAHGLSDGDEVIISLTTNYNGTYTIENVTTNTFDIVKAFTVNDATGTWDKIILHLYLEYYTRIRQLVNDSDVPDINEKWLWVVRLGALAKVYAYQKADDKMVSTQAMYASGVRSMVKSDLGESDYIPTLTRHYKRPGTIVTFSTEGYGEYGLVP